MLSVLLDAESTRPFNFPIADYSDGKPRNLFKRHPVGKILRWAVLVGKHTFGTQVRDDPPILSSIIGILPSTHLAGDGLFVDGEALD